MTQAVFESDVEVRKIDIITSAGRRLDIRDFILQLSIFEDIGEAVMQCEIVMRDSVSLKEVLPIIGEERVEIVFTKKGSKKILNYSFNVAAMPSNSINDKADASLYKLVCVSKEAIDNAKKQFSAAYKDTITEIVKDLFYRRLGSSRRLFFEPSSGVDNIVLTTTYPLLAINFLRNRARPVNGVGNKFSFFENHDGFVFKSIETIIKDGLKQSYKPEFIFSEGVNITEYGNPRAFRNIISLQMTQTFIDGAKEILPTTKEIAINTIEGVTRDSVVKTTLKEVFPKLPFTGQTLPFTEKQIGSHSNPRIVYSGFADGDYPNRQGVKSSNAAQDIIELLFRNMVSIVVPGDPTLTVGMMIFLKIPKVTGLNSALREKRQNYISGNFIITRLRHTIYTKSGGFHYECTADCGKMGFETV